MNQNKYRIIQNTPNESTPPVDVDVDVDVDVNLLIQNEDPPVDIYMVPVVYLL